MGTSRTDCASEKTSERTGSGRLRTNSPRSPAMPQPQAAQWMGAARGMPDLEGRDCPQYGYLTRVYGYLPNGVLYSIWVPCRFVYMIWFRKKRLGATSPVLVSNMFAPFQDPFAHPVVCSYVLGRQWMLFDGPSGPQRHHGWSNLPMLWSSTTQEPGCLFDAKRLNYPFQLLSVHEPVTQNNLKPPPALTAFEGNLCLLWLYRVLQSLTWLSTPPWDNPFRIASAGRGETNESCSGHSEPHDGPSGPVSASSLGWDRRESGLSRCRWAQLIEVSTSF